jgi:hypothetical protein
VSESLKELGDGLGVLLSQWKEAPAQSFSEVFRAASRPPRPPEIDGYMHFGDVDASSFPAETLHKFAKIRNSEVYSLLREYRAILAAYDFGKTSNDLTQFFRNLQERGFPKLSDSIDDHPIYSYRHSVDLGNEISIKKISPKYLEHMTANSVVTACFIPTFSLYLKHYAQGNERNRDAPKEYTRDYAGWKTFVTAFEAPATRFFFKPITAHIPFEAFKRHAYIVGGSGSGKSELLKLICHHIMTAKSLKDANMVLIDPHGDMADEIIRFRDCQDETAQGIRVFDPHWLPGLMPAINPFFIEYADKNEDAIEVLASNLADAFDEIIAESSLSQQMRTLLIPCISVLIRRDKSNLSDLQRFMVSAGNADLIEEGRNSPNIGQANFFKTMFSDKAYETTKRSIYTRLQSLLNSTNFRRMTSGNGSFELDYFLNEEFDSGQKIIIKLPKGTLGADVSSALGRLIIAKIKALGFRRQHIPKHLRRPTYVVIDECQNFIGESIETALTELRKFGIHMILANQIVGQDMSPQLRKIIFANTAVKITGYNDETSRSVMAKEMGADPDMLRTLTTGKFACKISDPHRSTDAFVFTAPNYLVKNRWSCSAEAWQARTKRAKDYNLHNSRIADLDDVGEERSSFIETDRKPDYVEPTGEGSSSPKAPKFKI